MKISVLSLKEKATTTLFFLLSNCLQVLNSLYSLRHKYITKLRDSLGLQLGGRYSMIME